MAAFQFPFPQSTYPWRVTWECFSPLLTPTIFCNPRSWHAGNWRGFDAVIIKQLLVLSATSVVSSSSLQGFLWLMHSAWTYNSHVYSTLATLIFYCGICVHGQNCTKSLKTKIQPITRNFTFVNYSHQLPRETIGALMLFHLEVVPCQAWRNATCSLVTSIHFPIHQ